MNTDLQPDNGDPLPKRTSPLRVTPLVGQYDTSTTTDMILQYAVGGDVKKGDNEGDDEQLENRIGYREMTENVFKGGWAIDVAAIGRRETEDIDTSQDHGHRYSRDLIDKIGDEEQRKTRVNELLTALLNTTQLAGQARHMADFMPDFVVGATLPVYNQRILNAVHVDSETREVDVDALKSVLTDLDNQGASVWMAGTHNPNVISNWDEVMDMGARADHVTVVHSVTECYEAMQPDLNDDE
jgi:CRISPR-associated protein Cas7/Cst2/DevR subtype I-B